VNAVIESWNIMKNKVNYVGKRFDRLLVVEDVGDRQVLCLCDCGVRKYIFKTNLSKKTKHKTRSCGCLKKEGKFRTLPNGESIVTCLFLEYKKSAIKRNLQFELTKEEFWSF
jgi:hypothetical protein